MSPNKPKKAKPAKKAAKARPAALFEDSVGQRVHKNNMLYYGDNLTIMRAMPDSSVDLIYLDPPFNSQRTYNLIYTKLTGMPLPEQEEAFCDAWTMDSEKIQMAEEIPITIHDKYGVTDDVAKFWKAWINALRTTEPRLLAYLVYMTYRLFEMRRILKSTGSIYLHCDPAASHYIKVMMDGVFGHANFRNEIIWQRTSAHSSFCPPDSNFTRLSRTKLSTPSSLRCCTTIRVQSSSRVESTASKNSVRKGVTVRL